MNNNRIKIVYIFSHYDGKYGVYMKKDIVNEQIVLSHLYILDENYVYHMPLSGSDIVIDMNQITGNNVMYIDMDKIGNTSVYEYIQDRIYAGVR